MEDKLWKKFCKTGRIEDYLMYNKTRQNIASYKKMPTKEAK